MKVRKEKMQKGFTVIDVLLGLAMVVSLGVLVKWASFAYPCAEDCLQTVVSADNMLDLLLNQYTVTFLIVSLLSLLSGNSECIYWVNILEQKIIKPLHRNFISLTIYSFLSMLAGTLAFFRKDVLLVTTFFFLDVIILVILTLKMVGVFFGKAKIQRNLNKEIVAEVRCYIDTNNTDVLESICAKLNGMYENAYRLSKDGKYEEILKTDFQLLVDLIELLPEQYDEKLVKALYDTLSKTVNLYAEDPEILLNEITGRNRKDQPKHNKHTEILIQCAMCSLFEIILSKHHYRVSYDRWIEEVYRILSEAYKKIDEELGGTILFSNGFEYHNLLVDVWNNPLNVMEEEETHRLVNQIENSVECIRGKLVQFANLIYDNSPSLFFEIVEKCGMNRDIQKHTELLKLVCRHDTMPKAIGTCMMICRQLDILKIHKYLKEYDAYSKMPTEIAKLNLKLESPFEKRDYYKLQLGFEAMLRYAAFEARSAEILECMLGCLNEAVVEAIIHLNKDKDKYPMLINDDTWDALYTNIRMTGADINGLFSRIEQEYAQNAGILLWVNKLKPLCRGNYDLQNYKMYMRANLSEMDYYNE